MPRVSVIIPLYNKAPFVDKCLQTVASQTFTDYECIIVNDGSTDNSAELVESWLKESINDNSRTINGHSCFKLISQPNSGVSAARNNGVKAAKGDYIAFLDADDWWEPTFLEKMVRFAEQYPDAGIYGCNYYIVKRKKRRQVFSNVQAGYINYAKLYYNTQSMPLCSDSVLIPRDLFIKIGGFNPQFKMAEDFDLWLRISLHYRVAFLNVPLANYNQDVQTRWRAIGKLYPPENQFAFNTNAFRPFELKSDDIHRLLDMVRISCLRQYYLSPKYRDVALKELQKIHVDEYRSQSFAAYLWQPVWITRLKMFMVNVFNTLRNL